jgi:Na+-transporting methylmalonyl-CoA/oxaloacetate decarboxylase gamma subunit
VIAEWWDQVSTTVIYGTQITVIGMLLVFFTLGLIIVAMILLTKLPWLQAKKGTTAAEPAPAEPISKAVEPAPVAETQAVASVDEELAQVAAIAVALLNQQQGPTRRLSRPQVRSAGRWKRSGRAYQVGLSTLE